MPRNEPDKKIRVLYPDEDSPITRFENGEGIRDLRLQEVAEDGTEERPLVWWEYTVSFDIVKARRILNVSGETPPSWDREPEDPDPTWGTNSSELIFANLIHTTDYIGGAKRLSFIGSSESLEDEHMHIHIQLAHDEEDDFFSVTAGRGWEDWETGDQPPRLDINIRQKRGQVPTASRRRQQGGRYGRHA